MKKLACLFSFLFCFCVYGQNVPVLAKPSGLLVTPPDFFTVNSNQIRVIASGNAVSKIGYAVQTNTAGTATAFYIDMSKAMQELRITNSSSLTFHTTNRAAGLTTMLRIKQTSAASLTMSFNSGWTNFVGSPPPTTLSSNVWAILSFSCWGPDETNVIAGYAVQPY